MIPLNSYAQRPQICINLVWRNVSYDTKRWGGPLCRAPLKLWTIQTGGPLPLDRVSARASQLDATSWGRIMWAMLLTVAALSLLISSALAAYATYLYFFGSSDSVRKGFPSVAPDEAARFDMDEHDI